jgi:hypothetical protein
VLSTLHMAVGIKIICSLCGAHIMLRDLLTQRAVAHPMPLGPTSIVFSFLISHRAEKNFGASWALWATFKLIKRVVKIFGFWRIFFLTKSQLLTPEMDSRAKTKCKTIKRYYFFSMKIKSFVPNFFGKTVKYHVPNKRPGSHVYG